MKTQADESLPCGSKAPTMPCLTAQNMTSHCYAGVLRSVYDEIFVLDFARDQCRELYRSTNVFETPAINKGLTALLDDVSANYVHPDDRAAFIALFNPETLDRIDEKRGFVSADVRKKCTTGGYRWAQVMLFRLQPPNEAQPLFLVGVEDVEERKRAAVLQRENETLQQQKLDSLRYKAVVDHTRTLVFEWRGTELNYLSHRIPELLAGNYDGRIPFEVWREDGVLFAGDNAAMDACLSRLALGVKSGETTVRLRRRDGQFIWCKVTYTALADGEPGDRYIGTLNDVDAITRSEQALRQRAELDPLTGAYNTQTFFEKVESLLKKILKIPTPCCASTWRASRPLTRPLAWKKATGCCGLSPAWCANAWTRNGRSLPGSLRMSLPPASRATQTGCCASCSLCPVVWNTIQKRSGSSSFSASAR